MSDSWSGAGTYLGSAALATTVAVGIYNHQQNKTLNDKLNEHGGIISALINKINNLQNIDSGVKSVADSLKELKETVFQLDESYKMLNQEISGINDNMNRLVNQVQLNHNNMAQQAKSIDSMLTILQQMDNIDTAKLYKPNYKSGRNNNSNFDNQTYHNQQIYQNGMQTIPNNRIQPINRINPMSNNIMQNNNQINPIPNKMQSNRRIINSNDINNGNGRNDGRRVHIKQTPTMHKISNQYNDDDDELSLLRN